jgi:hypothetical protein
MLSTAQSPMELTCGIVKDFFKGSACCGNSAKVLGMPEICPALDTLISYPAKAGKFSPVCRMCSRRRASAARRPPPALCFR